MFPARMPRPRFNPIFVALGRARTGLWVAALTLSVTTADAALAPEQVLLLYNSQNSQSLAIRNAYLAAHPTVLEFDLNDGTIGTGTIDRADYLSKIRDPLRAHLLTSPQGALLAEQVVAIVTTRGLPARIAGANASALEFPDPQNPVILSTYASLESDLSLLFQNLEAGAIGQLPTRDASLVDNPYHLLFQPIENFDRSSITTGRSFTAQPNPAEAQYWTINGLTPGDMYLVCRLDARNNATGTTVQNTIALINRSLSLEIDTRLVQAVFDEHSDPAQQFDDDGFGDDFPDTDDFAAATTTLNSLQIETLHDQGFNFLDSTETPDAGKSLLVLGTYGENHDFSGLGEDPPGDGTYAADYTNVHPAALFVSYESFNGHGLISGAHRGGQGHATDFIAAGASFTICHVAEPFTFAVADVDAFVKALYVDGLSFAEAAYISTPAISWQTTPVGDPLATVTVFRSSLPGDINADDSVDGTDLAALLAAWGSNSAVADINGDGVVDGSDLAALLAAWSG